METVKGVYQRAKGWEARYKKGTDADGKTIYGAVYAQTKEEVIKKREEKLKELMTCSTELNLLILGAGSHGRDVKEIAEELRIFKKISFLDDNLEGDDIIGTCKDLKDFRRQYPCAVVAIGNNKIRKKLAEQLKEYRFLIPSLVSKDANVSNKAEIGEGTVILPMARVGDAKIGAFGIVASNGLVNTGAELETYCHVDCGAIVKKDSVVTEGVWVKSGKVY